MVLDAGADRTVFDATFMSVLAPSTVPGSQSPRLRGVGGDVQCLFVQTVIALSRSDGNRVTISGSFGVFSDLAASDIPVLGRDVTNNFDVLYSYPARQVTLLAPPHEFQIRVRS
jgi:hypothetical protein